MNNFIVLDNGLKYSGIYQYAYNFSQITKTEYVNIRDKKHYLKSIYFPYPTKKIPIYSNPIMPQYKKGITIYHDLFFLKYDYRKREIWKNILDKFIGIEKLTESFHNYIIANSNYTLKQIEKLFPKRILGYLYPFIPLPKYENSFLLPPNKFYICHISDLNTRKNIPFIQKLFSILPENYYLIRIGLPIPNIKNQISYTNLNENEKNSLMKKCNLLIEPSIDEGFGIPVIEAMLNKVPVLANDISVFKEITNNTIMLKNLDINEWKEIILSNNFNDTEKAYSYALKYTDSTEYIKNAKRLLIKYLNLTS